VIISLMTPLLRAKPNRLAFMGVSYGAFAFIGPSVYDRVLWGALALVIAGYDWGSTGPDDQEAAPEEAPEPVTTRALPRRRFAT